MQGFIVQTVWCGCAYWQCRLYGRTVLIDCADCVGGLCKCAAVCDRLFCGQTVQGVWLTEWDSGHHKDKI